MKIEEAKTKWCPMVRMGFEKGTAVANSVTYMDFNNEIRDIYRNPDWSRCIADDCMMWYKLSSEFAGENEGVCGLVRKK